jgi:hypothetical protein
MEAGLGHSKERNCYIHGGRAGKLTRIMRQPRRFFSSLWFFLFFFFCSAGDGTKGLAHAR